MSLAFPLLCRKVWFTQFEECSRSLFKALADIKCIIRHANANANLHEYFNLFEAEKDLAEKLKQKALDSVEDLKIVHGNIYKPLSESNIECQYLAVEYSNTIGGDNVGLSLPANFPLDQIDPDFLFYELKKLKFGFSNSYLLPVQASSNLAVNEHVQNILLVATEPYDNKIASQPSSFFDSLSKSYSQLFRLFFKRLNRTAQNQLPTDPTQAKTLGGEEEQQKSAIKGKHWNTALLSYLPNPESHDDVVHIDNTCIVIKDKFPKAQFHFLILPRKEIDNVIDLTVEDIPSLEHMRSIAESFITKIKESSPSSTFLMGFHAIPSMRQLHMHLISTDLQSTGMKHKKHWNSFTTPFTIPLDTVIERLKTSEKIEIDREKYKEYLHGPLNCIHCSKNFKSFASLSSHLTSHNKLTFN